MATIGSWGNILTFKVSRRKALTFKDMKMKSSAEIAEHAVIKGKPHLQFVAPNLGEVTFRIEVEASRYKKPAKLIEILKAALETGIYAPLVVGNRVILSRAILTDFSTDFETIISRGKIWGLAFDITMKEYN